MKLYHKVLVARELAPFNFMRKKSTGHKLEGEIAIVKELTVEGEILDYEKVLVTEFDGEVKKVLRKLDVDNSIILGVKTVELASIVPDTSTGKLRKIETSLSGRAGYKPITSATLTGINNFGSELQNLN